MIVLWVSITITNTV